VASRHTPEDESSVKSRATRSLRRPIASLHFSIGQPQHLGLITKTDRFERASRGQIPTK
jgi:hypothetical protein